MSWASLVAQWERIHLPVQEMQVCSLGQEYLLEKEMATHCSILAWEIPGTEEPGGLQSTGSQRVGHHSATKQQEQSICLSLSSRTYFVLWPFPKKVEFSISHSLVAYQALASGSWIMHKTDLPFTDCISCFPPNPLASANFPFETLLLPYQFVCLLLPDQPSREILLGLKYQPVSLAWNQES